MRYLNIFISLSAFLFFWQIQGFNLFTSFGISLTVFTSIVFITSLGKKIPVKEIIFLIACLQWIIGPINAYLLGNNHYKYFMSVPELEYMSIVIPAIVCFGAGLMLFNSYEMKYQSQILKTLKSKLVVDSRIPDILLAIGLSSLALMSIVPVQLAFIFFLLSGCQYIALLFLLFNQNNKKWIYFAIVLLFNISFTLASGMFHDILLWILWLFMYINLTYKLSIINKVVIILAGVFFIYLLQSVKGEYREEVWANENYEDQGELMVALMSSQLEQEAVIEDPGFLEAMNARLNQGWIISRIMFYVPAYEPFANGETIKDALVASLLPRIFFENKKGAGGRENFERFTGYTLRNTAMGVSILGEAYANFGFYGACLLMFVWGLLLNFAFYIILALSLDNPTVFLWIPLIFMHVIKAETDLITVLNFLVKSSLFVFIFYLISRRFIGIRI